MVKESLKQHQEAIAYEEKAINIEVNREQRFYFLELLARLSNLYFENGKYLAAYQTKLNVQSFKQQFGLIAFVGPKRIKASKDNLTNLAQEIANSGRQYDVDELINRISSRNNKVTIIYGQSGVGKSSILEAGLIPKLQQKQHIDLHSIIPINLRVYNNWKQDLGNLLNSFRSPLAPLKKGGNYLNKGGIFTTELLIEMLKSNDQENMITILFFDQFEEFFFVTKDQKEVNEFFNFFRECLKIVYLKIVFSLREDYLYLLLRGTRNLNLDAINNDLFKKDILYYLGNLSPQVTKDLIRNLTHRCDFDLEADLIDQLVADLTTDLGEIRPIELQIIGSQIQAENITTLAQYNEYDDIGEKRTEKLVNNYLDAVINSCGEENIEVAKLVLSLLIDEKNNTRPLKTKLEISEALSRLEIEEKEQKLDLVLKIFVLSGLVMLLPEKPTNRYQLVHDYLIEVIRKRQGNSLLAKLEQAEADKKRFQTNFNRLAMGTFAVSIILTTWAISSTLQSRHNEIRLLSQSSQLYSKTKRESLESIVLALQARKKLLPWTKKETREEITLALSQSVDYVHVDYLHLVLREANRLIGHQDWVISVAFAPDGQTIASASVDKTIKLWNLNLDDLVKQECDWVGDYLRNSAEVSEEDRDLCN